MPESEEELKKRPEAFNFLNIFASITKTPLENIINDMAGKEFSLIKTKLSDVLVSEICPVGKEITKLMADQSYLKKILIKGQEKAQLKAEENLKKVREIIGLL